MKKNNMRMPSMLFTFLYFFIGVSDLTQGASEGSNLYHVDNILIRVIGVLFIIACFGIILKKEMGRKLILGALLLSIIEMFIGYPTDYSNKELIKNYLLYFVLFVPGAVFYIRNKEYYKR